MNSLLYVLSVILVIGWLVGFFALSLGGLIHILLVMALVAILLRLIRGRSV
ncbi:lmo0937 family membrane protein [Luteibaculum oceani]|uniref:Lmo0937 family membrane protein n=1 Tax=Luteibaculum oceani TaxID=1294296 RepID=A0A5C6V970_9FLAO|nr:lmo0937 family membrane protein [Luteibaculum oceani]TXC81667.1 lmo0937 family membrane protein [Luteibaculum oceani]